MALFSQRPVSEDEDEEYQPNKKPKGRARKKTEEANVYFYF